MDYAFKMRSAAMTYIRTFIRISPGIQKLIQGIRRHTDNKVISYVHFSFFQNKGSRLKMYERSR
jgi:hypothetical protein